jgi:hypothetical protein
MPSQGLELLQLSFDLRNSVEMPSTDAGRG